LKITLSEVREKDAKKSKAQANRPTVTEAKKEEPAVDVTGENI
jgi:hypothetical protein